MLDPNVVHKSFLRLSFEAIRYAGIIDISVAMNLFLIKLKFIASPNSVIIYRWILVAESKVVAANETTRTTIKVWAI